MQQELRSVLKLAVAAAVLVACAAGWLAFGSAPASAKTEFEAEVTIGQRVTGTCVPFRSDPGTDGLPPPGYHDFTESTWTVFSLGGDQLTGGWIGQTDDIGGGGCKDSPDPIILNEPGRYWATTYHQMWECWWDWEGGTPPVGESAKTYGCFRQPGGAGGLDDGKLDVDETTVNYYVVRGWKTDALRELAAEIAEISDLVVDTAGVVCPFAIFLPGGGLIAAAGCGATGAAALASRQLARWIAKDPPDPNYRQIAEPKRVTAPKFHAGKGISANQARAINAYADEALELKSYQAAFATSFERWAGVDSRATDATSWWKRQEDAADRYAAAAATRLDNLAGLRKKLVRALGKTAKLKLTDNLVRKSRDRARRHGFPASVVKTLRTAGLVDSEIRELLNAARRANARKIPDTFAQILNDKKLAAAERELAAKLRQFPG